MEKLINTRTETNHSPHAIKQAKRFYKWLWWSPVLLVPTTAVLLLLNDWFFNSEEWKIFAFSAIWHLAFLVLPALGHKVTFVRWHARQALLIALIFTLLQIFINAFFVGGLIICAYVIHFLITLWGFLQIDQGENWFANWFGINIQGDDQKDIEKGIEKLDKKSEQHENIEIIKLEYLINETVDWKVAKKVRQPYIEKLEALKEILFPKPTRSLKEIIHELFIFQEALLKINSLSETEIINPQSAINIDLYLSKKIDALNQELEDQEYDKEIPDELEVTGFILDSIEDWFEEGLITDSKKLEEAMFLQRDAILKPPPKEEKVIVTPEPELEIKLESVEEEFFEELEPVEVQPEPAPRPVIEKVAPKPTPKPTPPREKVPFDQWLLSERNIKIALYSGALLLVVAGIIFVGVNWVNFSGSVKFSVTLFITVMMYLGGYLLHRRSALKLGGNALIGIASGFLVLNFVVLQLYVLRPMGLQDDVMWLIASPLSLILYMLTAYWTRSDLFTYFSIVALGSTVAAALVVFEAPSLAFALAAAIMMLLFLGLSQWIKSTQVEEFTSTQLWWVAQIGMPLVIFVSIVIWSSFTNCTICTYGSPWLAIASLFIGVIFYWITDVYTKTLSARWITVVFFTVVLGIVASELNFTDSRLGITFMTEAIVFLIIGYILKGYGEPSQKIMPIYLIAYGLAIAVTVMASSNLRDFATVLIGDVIFLTIASYVNTDHRFIYGAVWLLMIPIYIFTGLRVENLYTQGLQLSILGIIYVVAGFILGRRKFQYGSPFLTAAIVLSAGIVIMTWSVPLTSFIVLVVVAGLYISTALWRRWTNDSNLYFHWTKS